ncbi:hypothetical protein GGF42_002270 [Coemansia sp. RSA 2424]|nr:hypothetical protein GGF42_002270 [Coemansia sp. RSA 2424]
MLSNGISSRLQQLHSVKENKTCHDATAVSAEHGWQAASTIVVPARSGLAADLIKKFNQMSAVGHDGLAAIGRSATSTTRHQPNKGARLPLRMSFAIDGEYDDCGCQAVVPETADDDDSISCASVGSDSSTAVGGALSKGTSPFLSDSELSRALLEIREFSRNMNISLLEDDM